MAKQSLVVTNLGEIDAVFSELNKGLQNRVLSYATREAARPVLAKAKSLVPVRTGNLRRSLAIRAMKRTRRRKYIRGVLVTTRDGMFKGEQFYGGFVEFGTKRARAKPFLRPAVDAEAGRARLIFRHAIQEGLSREAARASKRARVKQYGV